MRRSILLALLALLAGCHATTSLEPPVPPEGTRSMLLVAVGEDGYQLAFAIDVPADGSAPHFPTFTRPPEIDLYSVNFTCPLDVLGMDPGRLVVLADPAPRLELPEPRSIFSSHDGDVQSAWEETTDRAAIEPILRSIELPERNLCRLYGVQLAPLDVSFLAGTSTPTALIALRNDKVLVANADGTFWEVDADRNVRPLPLLTGAPKRGGFTTNDGTVYLVGDDGTIARGDPDRGVEIVQTGGATVTEFTLVDGARVGPIEIYRASFGRPFERWDGTGWTQLTSGGAELEHGTYAVAWIGPNEAIATGVLARSNSAIRYLDGDLIDEPMPGAERPTAIASIAGAGIVVGTQRGVILRDRDGTFVAEPESGIDSQIRNIIPTKSGFFYGRTRWGSWDPIAGYCPSETISADGSRVAPLGERGFLAIGDLFLENSFLFTLDRIDVDHPCLAK
jgi:hypothetical protein